MQQRIATLVALLLFGLLAFWGVTRQQAAPADSDAGRVTFQVATGPSGSPFFALGQAIAGLISHPRGAARCETSTVCAPSGMILSARTSQGSLDNLRAVNDGLVDSALVQADMADAAARGRTPFRGKPLANLRVVAALFPEEVHLVAGAATGIAEMRNLSRKRVWLAPQGTDAGDTARRILSAFRISVRAVEGDDPVALLAEGKIDAFFLAAAAPYGPVTQALQGGKAILLPIEGPVVERLLRAEPQLQHATIAAETYPRTLAVNTIATRTLWVVNAKVPDAQVYGITRALFNPVNREALTGAHPAAHKISMGSAVLELPMGIHPGARRYYREAGVLAR